MERSAGSGKVIGHLRISTDEQAVSGLGPGDQRDVIASQAARRGWADVEFLPDEGYSAKYLSRPAHRWRARHAR